MVSNYVEQIRGKIGHMPMFVPSACLIIYKNGNVLLQKRADDKKWDMHGGFIEPNETIMEALNREIKEELNIKPINPELMGIYTGYNKYPNEDEVYLCRNCFICTEYDGEISFNDNEVLEIKWFDINNLPNDMHECDRNVLEDVKKYIDIKKPIIK
ncbi:MAG: NUDIX domain-containing protein [Clostridia bacterium]|nr:NUDIX domain-containing protein [Clostridia bacterium]